MELEQNNFFCQIWLRPGGNVYCSVSYIQSALRVLALFSDGCKRNSKEQININFEVLTSCISNSRHELISYWVVLLLHWCLFLGFKSDFDSPAVFTFSFHPELSRCLDTAGLVAPYTLVDASIRTHQAQDLQGTASHHLMTQTNILGEDKAGIHFAL